MVSSRLLNRNVVATEGRTSMRLEPEIWDAMAEICARERTSQARLVQAIERDGPAGARTSAVRVHVLRYFRSAATEVGHAAAGHGGLPDAAGLPTPG